MDVARAFVSARRSAQALSAFPGVIPSDLSISYAIQDQAIGLWGDDVIGWKVGYVTPPLQPSVGSDRLAGPIFRKQLRSSTPDGPVIFPVFEGGFAAVEGEFVYRLGADAPASKLAWTAAEALALTDAVFIAIETAGSPLATINVLGPFVVAADFGNNAGLILGAEIPGGLAIAHDDLACSTSIDGEVVGTGRASDLAGGPGAAIAFLLTNLARRGRPARGGDLISTGAVTGIHDIRAGQTARIDFGAFGDILCQAEMARPEPA